MKEVTILHVHGNAEDSYARLLDIAATLRLFNPSKLEPIFFHPRVRRPSGEKMAGFRMYFEGYSADWSDTCKALRSQGFSADFTCRRSFSRKDLESAQFLLFGGGRRVKSSGRFPLRWEYGDPYPCCSFRPHVWQFEDVRILDRIDGDFVGRIDGGPHVVTAELGQRLLDEGFTGLNFSPIGDRNGRARWWVLDSSHVLPALQCPPTHFDRGYESSSLCPNRHGVDYPHSEFFYSRDSFYALDFNLTYEQFNIMGYRELIVSNRVYRFLVKDQKLRRLTWTPIRLTPTMNSDLQLHPNT